jgi:putative oxidoreductase
MSTQTLNSTAKPIVATGFPGSLLRTDASVPALVARLVLGAVMLPHGLQKAFGLFGGYGFEGTMGFLTGSVGLPWIVALLVVLIETLGAVALIVGALGRLAALGTVAVMVGAVATSHVPNGFFMNWTGQQAGEGFEYHLLAIGLATVVLIAGSGKASVDRLLSR